MMVLEPPFIRSVMLMRARIEEPDEYPFSLPAVQGLDGLELSSVTYFIGENGSGKLTIVEAPSSPSRSIVRLVSPTSDRGARSRLAPIALERSQAEEKEADARGTRRRQRRAPRPRTGTGNASSRRRAWS